MRLITLIILSVLALRGFADISPNVSVGTPVYSYLEKLEALGCAYTTFRDLGPQSFGDLRASVDWDPAQTSCQAPVWLMDERQLLLRASLAAEVNSQAFLAFDDRVTLPKIPASLWPIFPNRENRPEFNGLNVASELFVSGRGGGRDFGYAIAVNPGFYFGHDVTSGFMGRFYVQEIYGKVGYGASELSFGRYGRRFGSTRHGGVLYSGAAAPMDVIEYSLRPRVPGGAFSFFGPVTFRTWFGNQGADAAVPGTNLWGVEIGMRPFRWFEFAFSEVSQFGGTGAPTVSLVDTLQMLLGGGGTGLANLRNTRIAISSSFWSPGHFAKLYGQLLWDRVGDDIASPMSGVAGLWLPRLDGWDLRFEYAKTAEDSYTHPFWTQGFTYRGSPLGHPLGPDGEGAYIDIGIPPIATWWHSEVGAVYEARSLNPPAGKATERRYGGYFSTGRRWRLADLSATVAYHQVHGSQYVPGEVLDVFGVGLQFRYTFFY